MKIINYQSLEFKPILLLILLVILALGGCTGQPSYHQPQPQQVQPVVVPEPVPEEVTAHHLASISNIEVKEQEDDTIRVIINGSEPLTYNATEMEFPLRLVVDVEEARLDMPTAGIPVEKGVITEITPLELEKDGKTTARIEVELNSYMAQYKVFPSGNNLYIDFFRPQSVKKANNIIGLSINDVGDFVQVDILADGTIEDYNSFDLEEPARLVIDFPGLKTLMPVKEKECSSPVLKKVRWGKHPDYLRVVLDSVSNELPPFQVVPTTKGLTVFLGSGFEKEKERLVAMAPSSPVTKEEEPTESTGKELAELQSQKKEPAMLLTKVEKEPASDLSLETASPESKPGKSISTQSSAEPSASDPTPPPEEPLQPSQEKMSEETPEQQQAPEADVVEKPGGSPPLNLATVEEEKATPRYTGAHISLDFKDADIKNILRLIAEVSNLNIVAGEDVQGTVTIRLTDVPWDQALDVILLSNKLGKTLEGNILRIAPIERLNREKQAVIAARETADKLEPLKKGLIPVSYADASQLKEVVINSKVLSPRGSIEIDPRTNTMIVIDIEKNIREVRRIIDQLDSPTPQVLIEAKVVQINPTYTKELGVSWESSYSTTSGNDALIGVGGSGGVDIDLGKGTVTSTGNIIDLAPAVGPGVGGAISWGYLEPGFGIFQKIAALEKEEKVEIISSPRIMTLDNQEAMVEQGVDLPYLKLSEEGVTSTEFKKATLSLKVVPHVTADGSIMMDIEVKKDQKSAQTGAGGEPGIDTRRATTKVLVRNRSTVVIGGIYEQTATDIHNSVPYLGRLPLLSFFFKSTTKNREKTELIIFITPTIITLPKKSHEMEVASSPLS